MDNQTSKMDRQKELTKIISGRKYDEEYFNALEELTKLISGRKFDQEYFNEVTKEIYGPEVSAGVGGSEEPEGAELKRVNSNGFSQQSQEFYNETDNITYLSSKNKDIYPVVKMGYTFDDIFMTIPKKTELFKMNWHDCVKTIEFHNQQSELKKTITHQTGARFEQIWFAENPIRTEDYFYNFKKDDQSKRKILDYFRDNNNSELSLIYKFILNNDTDVLNLAHLETITRLLTNIPLTTKSLFNFFNKEYRTIYISESELNFSSIFSDNDTEFCKLIINFAFGGLDVDSQIKFLEDLKAIKDIWERKSQTENNLFNSVKKKEFFEAYPFKTFDDKNIFWIQDVQGLLEISGSLDKRQINQRVSIMFFDMIALFSLFSGFIYSHGLIIPGYYYPPYASLWRREDNTEIAMINIGKIIEPDLFTCNGVYIDEFLKSYINLKDERGNYVNGKMKTFIEKKNEKTNIFGKLGGMKRKKKLRSKRNKKLQSKKHKKQHSKKMYSKKKKKSQNRKNLKLEKY